MIITGYDNNGELQSRLSWLANDPNKRYLDSLWCPTSQHSLLYNIPGNNPMPRYLCPTIMLLFAIGWLLSKIIHQCHHYWMISLSFSLPSCVPAMGLRYHRCMLIHRLQVKLVSKEINWYSGDEGAFLTSSSITSYKNQHRPISKWIFITAHAGVQQLCPGHLGEFARLWTPNESYRANQIVVKNLSVQKLLYRFLINTVAACSKCLCLSQAAPTM